MSPDATALEGAATGSAPGHQLVPPGLRAQTRPLDGTHPVDLLQLAGDGALLLASPGLRLAGRGRAVVIRLPRGIADLAAPTLLAEALSAIESEDPVGRPGSGPVALASLPFDREAPAELVVPAELWVEEVATGASWVTRIVDDAGRVVDRTGLLAETPRAERSGSTGPQVDPRSPDAFEVRSALPHEEWCARAERVLEEIRAGRVEKVVLARRVDVRANRPFVVEHALRRLAALYPACALFSIAGLLGASPELLVRRLGRAVVAQPLAGTVARSGDAAADDAAEAQLQRAPKERNEHGFVVRAVVEGLQRAGVDVEVPRAPEILRLRNVSHLATTVRGCAAGSPPASAFELVRAIHPTPAVAGVPTDVALATLATHEELDRGCWAGPVGWMDARGDGEWWLGIRSALVEGAEAHLIAGVGLVAGSDPEAELAETQLKLQALLSALVRP
jgi:menaquinone-specific isochorismate synthase